MKLGSVFIFTLAILSLAACSKEDSGGGNGATRGDITQFKVESLGEEQSITETDYAARLKENSRRPKICREKVFGNYKKGETFISVVRTTTPGPSAPIKVEFTSTETVALVKERELVFSAIISGTNDIAKSLEGSKSIKKCVARNGRVSCQSSLGSSNSNSNSSCDLKNRTQTTASFSTGSFTLQDGRKVPVLVKRSSAKGEYVCKNGTATPITYSEVSVRSNALKNPKGLDCTSAESTEVYSYGLMQKEAGDLMAEMDTRLVFAPAK